nr:MAG TPA_asm: hypothetical protein [Caudoviricetes sp.]
MTLRFPCTYTVTTHVNLTCTYTVTTRFNILLIN